MVISVSLPALFMGQPGQNLQHASMEPTRTTKRAMAVPTTAPTFNSQQLSSFEAQQTSEMQSYSPQYEGYVQSPHLPLASCENGPQWPSKISLLLHTSQLDGSEHCEVVEYLPTSAHVMPRHVYVDSIAVLTTAKPLAIGVGAAMSRFILIVAAACVKNASSSHVG